MRGRPKELHGEHETFTFQVTDDGWKRVKSNAARLELRPPELIRRTLAAIVERDAFASFTPMIDRNVECKKLVSVQLPAALPPKIRKAAIKLQVPMGRLLDAVFRKLPQR